MDILKEQTKMIDDGFEKAFPKDMELLNNILERANVTDEELEKLAKVLVDLFTFYGFTQKVGRLNV